MKKLFLLAFTAVLPGMAFGQNTASTLNSVGIGVSNPQSKLDVKGGAAIGAAYSGSVTAPSNGLIVARN